SNTVQTKVAAPTPIITLAIAYGSQRTVTLSGQVIGLKTAWVTVTFTGEVHNTTTTNQAGCYSFTTQADGLGPVYAQAVDNNGTGTNVATVTVSCAAPVIQDFEWEEMPDHYFLFVGKVVAPYAEGLVVQFGGLPSLEHRTAIVEADGWFSLIVQLQPGEEGTVAAQTIDWWAQL